MFKSICAAVAALSLASAPVLASSWKDVETLTELIKGTGTTITTKECKDGRVGSYQFVKGKIDEMTLCTDAFDTKSADDTWEVLVHESVHVMQACAGDHIVKLKYHPRILREIKSHAPHYWELLKGYSTDHKLVETEAFWMELQSPSVAIKWMQDFCYKDS